MSDDKKNKESDQVLDHNYDGIEEYDNDLPRWWISMFWGCIAIGILYVLYFHVGSGRFTSEKLEDQMALIRDIQDKSKKKIESSISEETLLLFASNPENVAAGNKIFAEKCMPCHAMDAGGLIGPNLTDEYWIHGGSLMDIRKVILDGVPEKGMISWQALMTSDEVKQVTAYIHTLRGTTPAAPKEPQGEKFIYK